MINIFEKNFAEIKKSFNFALQQETTLKNKRIWKFIILVIGFTTSQMRL